MLKSFWGSCGEGTAHKDTPVMPMKCKFSRTKRLKGDHRSQCWMVTRCYLHMSTGVWDQGSCSRSKDMMPQKRNTLSKVQVVDQAGEKCPNSTSILIHFIASFLAPLSPRHLQMIIKWPDLDCKKVKSVGINCRRATLEVWRPGEDDELDSVDLSQTDHSKWNYGFWVYKQGLVETTNLVAYLPVSN